MNQARFIPLLMILAAVAVRARAGAAPAKPADYTVNQSSACPRHHVPMAVERVPIRYGYPKGEERRDLLMREDCPYANLGYALGGCEVMPEKEADVFVCGKCNEARRKKMRKK
jgi:hypothetical protein